jgi:hypothetical protein
MLYLDDFLIGYAELTAYVFGGIRSHDPSPRFQYDYTFDWTMLKQKAALSAAGVEGAANGTTQPPTTPGGR